MTETNNSSEVLKDELVNNSRRPRKEIVFGKQYPIKVVPQSFTALNFLFKPCDIDTSRGGHLTIYPDSKNSELSLHRNNEGLVQFQGLQSKPDDLQNEKFMYFDGSSFNIASVETEILHLKVKRDEKVYNKFISAKVTNHIQKASSVENFKKRKQSEKSSIKVKKTSINTVNAANDSQANNTNTANDVQAIDKAITEDLQKITNTSNAD